MSLREDLAALEHEQWVKWSKSLVNSGEEITKWRLNRWEKLWCGYEDLSEDWKDSDREWADRVLHILKVYGVSIDCADLRSEK